MTTICLLELEVCLILLLTLIIKARLFKKKTLAIARGSLIYQNMFCFTLQFKYLVQYHPTTLMINTSEIFKFSLDKRQVKDASDGSVNVKGCFGKTILIYEDLPPPPCVSGTVIGLWKVLRRWETDCCLETQTGKLLSNLGIGSLKLS